MFEKQHCDYCNVTKEDLYLVRLYSNKKFRLKTEPTRTYDSDEEFDYIGREGIFCKKCTQKIFQEYMDLRDDSMFCKLEIL